MIRKPAKELEVGEAIFLGPDKIRSRVLDISERCQTELVVPELRQYVQPKKLVEVWLRLAQSTIVEETGYRASFFTVFLPPDQIIRVVERDSQRAAA